MHTNIFNHSNFEKTIRGYCQEIGWTPSVIEADYAKLKFEMESGHPKTLYILRLEEVLEFSVLSQLFFEEGDEIQSWMLTRLLLDNAKSKTGFWCIETIKNKMVFSFMHNAELRTLDCDRFAAIVTRLVGVCDDLETDIEAMMESKLGGLKDRGRELENDLENLDKELKRLQMLEKELDQFEKEDAEQNDDKN